MAICSTFSAIREMEIQTTRTQPSTRSEPARALSSARLPPQECLAGVHHSFSFLKYAKSSVEIFIG